MLGIVVWNDEYWIDQLARQNSRKCHDIQIHILKYAYHRDTPAQRTRKPIDVFELIIITMMNKPSDWKFYFRTRDWNSMANFLVWEWLSSVCVLGITAENFHIQVKSKNLEIVVNKRCRWIYVKRKVGCETLKTKSKTVEDMLTLSFV